MKNEEYMINYIRSYFYKIPYSSFVRRILKKRFGPIQIHKGYGNHLFLRLFDQGLMSSTTILEHYIKDYIKDYDED